MDGGSCLKQDSQDLQDGIPRDRSVKNEIRPFTVARGPVPRDRSGKPKTVRSPEAPAVSVTSAAWRGTGPRPT